MCRPSEEDTPPNRFYVRTSIGRFAISKEFDVRADLHCIKNLAAKRKSVSVSVKLEFENSSDENEPPSKCSTIAAKVRFEILKDS